MEGGVGFSKTKNRLNRSLEKKRSRKNDQEKKDPNALRREKKKKKCVGVGPINIRVRNSSPR